MAAQDFQVTLQGGGPWGFRLKGGKDFGQSLTVSQLTPGGKAVNYGVNVGDQILAINGANGDDMTHMEAQDNIKRTGDNLRLQVHRPSEESQRLGRAPLTITQTTHSAQADHKYNAIPKPFGATSYQPPPRQQPIVQQAAPVVRTGPPTAAKPMHSQQSPHPPPPAPAYSQAPAYSSGGQYNRDQVDNDYAMRAKKKEIEDEMLAQRFKLNISDDGEVNYDGGEEGPSWGHPPNPNVQSKSFKRLQRHLQSVEPEDDLPPPPPEAYGAPEDDNGTVQSKSFQMLTRAVDSGETPPSVFSRTEGDRSKPSTTPLPMSRPSAPHIRPAHEPMYAPPPPMAARPGQQPPVALPGMVRMEPARPQQSQNPPRGPPQRQQGYQPPPPASSYPSGQQEIKRQPAKPPQPRDGPRTPFCDACAEPIQGPFVSAIGKSWHPDHFNCAGCGESLQNQGFIEEGDKLYCEKDYNKLFAPHCETCKMPIVGPCVQAIGKTFHPEHFTCSNRDCLKQIGSEGFNVDKGQPFCEMCYKKLFCTKCSGCKRAIGGGERWVEAMDEPWHANCFKCATCNKLLEGSPFYQYSGKPYCTLHGAP